MLLDLPLDEVISKSSQLTPCCKAPEGYVRLVVHIPCRVIYESRRMQAFNFPCSTGILPFETGQSLAKSDASQDDERMFACPEGYSIPKLSFLRKQSHRCGCLYPPHSISLHILRISLLPVET
jgi:hypothetical protein